MQPDDLYFGKDGDCSKRLLGIDSVSCDRFIVSPTPLHFWAESFLYAASFPCLNTQPN